MAWSYLPRKFPVLPARPPRATAGVSAHPPRARMTAHLPKGRMLHRRSPSSVQARLSTFFTSSSELPTCGCCKDKLLGDIVVCPGCNQRVHALCKEAATCFRCVCRVCDSPPGDVMRPCKSCMHRVHNACTIAVPHRIEWVCKTCIPKPQGPAPPAKKRTRRHFNPQWQVGRPWLRFRNGVMWCVAKE